MTYYYLKLYYSVHIKFIFPLYICKFQFWNSIFKYWNNSNIFLIHGRTWIIKNTQFLRFTLKYLEFWQQIWRHICCNYHFLIKNIVYLNIIVTDLNTFAINLVDIYTISTTLVVPRNVSKCTYMTYIPDSDSESQDQLKTFGLEI